jgi:hypothetical protein
MKTVLLGDTHGRSIWKDIIKAENPDRVIFWGDYFDSFDIPGVSQISNFKDIIDFKESTDKEVIMLIGNHDHHYMDAGKTYSGHQAALHWDIHDLLKQNKHHLQVAYQLDNIICTHAGLSPVWLSRCLPGWQHENVVELVNDLFNYHPQRFNFSHLGYDPYGDHESQGPFWIRIRALMKSNKGEDGFKKDYIQIVGHTQVKSIIDSFGVSEKAMGGKYYMIDAQESNGYAVYENGQLTPAVIDIM